MDNLKYVTEQIDSVLNPAGGTSSVLVAQHNPLEKLIINTIGRYTGTPFTAKRSPTAGKVPAGSMFWNTFAMNKSNANFVIYFSDQTLDANKFGRILSLLTEGDLIHFKDFEGRSTLLKFFSATQQSDPDGLIYHEVEVIGFAENISYAYQVSDIMPCMVEIIRGGAGGGSGNTVTPYYHTFTKSGGVNAFAVPAGFAPMVVQIEEGRGLKQGTEWTIAGTVLTNLSADLENGMKLYTSGIIIT